MFRRQNKNLSPTSPPSTADEALDQTAEAVQTRPYYEEISERITAYRAAHDALIQEAIERGVPDAELAGLLADAMNSRAVPRIANGGSFRGSGVNLMLLDGNIPASALQIQVRRKADGSFGRSMAELAKYPPESEVSSEDSFTAQETGILPQIDNGEPTDQAMLSLIDEHLIVTHKV